MHPSDPSAAESLLRLLEEQHLSLHRVAEKVELLHSMGVQQTQHSQWSGASRQAHDELAERMIARVMTARNALERASDESARAVATLATRVG